VEEEEEEAPAQSALGALALDDDEVKDDIFGLGDGPVVSTSYRRPRKCQQRSGDVDNQKEPCWYGIDCYQLNEAHFRTFSHPANHPCSLEQL
jgi:hypothetical protein